MALSKSIQEQVPSNTLDFGADIVRSVKNPLRALFLPINWLWKLGRPMVGMSNKEILQIPEELAKLAMRAGIGAVTYSTRLAINGILSLPVLPTPSGKGMRNIREAFRGLKHNLPAG